MYDLQRSVCFDCSVYLCIRRQKYVYWPLAVICKLPVSIMTAPNDTELFPPELLEAFSHATEEERISASLRSPTYIYKLPDLLRIPPDLRRDIIRTIKFLMRITTPPTGPRAKSPAGWTCNFAPLDNARVIPRC